jgi:uncharacterized protein (TIGR03118 family)
MKRYAQWIGAHVIAAVGLAVIAGACSDNTTTNPPATTTSYSVTKLVADDASAGAASVDADLVNPWGMAFGPTGILWVANNHSGTSTLYNAGGSKVATVVAIPSKDSAAGGAPTGVIYNGSSDFAIPGGGAALFIFAGEDGTISSWGASMTSAQLVADRSAGDAVYKGIAMATNGGANYLYATDFKNSHVDVFNGTYQYVKSFTDANIPAGFAPFGIQNINGMLYVTYAKQEGAESDDDEPGVGNGYVDVFNPDGTLLKRFASTGTLNSPWAVALAPQGFGSFSGDILVGNFGDGMIGAYDQSGKFLGMLHDAGNTTISIEGLWGLTFGPSNSTTLYFTAGPDDENHGLLGTLKPM